MSLRSQKMIMFFVAVLLFGLAVFAYIAAPKEEDAHAPAEDTPAYFADKQSYVGGGIYRDAPVVNGMKSFQSDLLGVSFRYPRGYVLFEYGGSASSWAPYSLTIAPEGPMREAIERAKAQMPGEGPAAITFTFYRKPSAAMTLEQWMRSDTAHSNFTADSASEVAASLHPTTVDGRPAFAWHSNFGLYATDYVAFAYGEWFVIISAADDTAKDLPAVLSSVRWE